MSLDPPLFTECVIGFRTWNPVTQRAGDPEGTNRLPELMPTGMAKAGPWKPGVNVAACMKATWAKQFHPQHKQFYPPSTSDPGPPHDAPRNDCQCGFYGLHERWGAIPALQGKIAGMIAAWGRLEVHRGGFRAQYAQILALEETHHPERRDYVYAAAEYYGVPVVEERWILREGQRHGALLPESIRPELITPTQPKPKEEQR